MVVLFSLNAFNSENYVRTNKIKTKFLRFNDIIHVTSNCELYGLTLTKIEKIYLYFSHLMSNK